MSSNVCRSCGKGIKQKHLQRAKDCGHKPPVLCYSCTCAEKKKKSPRERKIELSKRKARERDKIKPP